MFLASAIFDMNHLPAEFADMTSIQSMPIVTLRNVIALGERMSPIDLQTWAAIENITNLVTETYDLKASTYRYMMNSMVSVKRWGFDPLEFCSTPYVSKCNNSRLSLVSQDVVLSGLWSAQRRVDQAVSPLKEFSIDNLDAAKLSEIGQIVDPYISDAWVTEIYKRQVDFEERILASNTKYVLLIVGSALVLIFGQFVLFWRRVKYLQVIEFDLAYRALHRRHDYAHASRYPEIS